MGLCDGFVSGPILIQAFLKYSDPSMDGGVGELDMETKSFAAAATTDFSDCSKREDITSVVVNDKDVTSATATNKEEDEMIFNNYDDKVLLTTLSLLRNRTLIELDNINRKLDNF